MEKHKNYAVKWKEKDEKNLCKHDSIRDRLNKLPYESQTLPHFKIISLYIYIYI